LTALEKHVDVAVIGGGPAGISACLELVKVPGIRIALFESEAELGGMPRSCHVFFGMRDMKRLYSGPQYARKLSQLVRKTRVDIHTNATALQIIEGKEKSRHLVKIATPEGLITCKCKYLLLATGCFESSRESRRIPGTRPAGIYTTGSLQQVVNLQKLKPGRKALILGSENVAFSAALTLHRAGIKIAGLVSEDSRLQTYPLAAKAISIAMGFKIFDDTDIENIFGKKRVEGATLIRRSDRRSFEIDCDTVVCTGKFRPDAALIYQTSIAEDQDSRGPLVDMNYMTSSPRIFAAGNVLRGADMHDICALEGRQVAVRILDHRRGNELNDTNRVTLSVSAPLRYAVPQVIFLNRARTTRTSCWSPGVSVQSALTLKRVTIEVWSGDRKLYSKRCSRLIANSRFPLQVERFDWEKADLSKPIMIKVVEDQF